MLKNAKKILCTGGDLRIIHTLPPLVFAAYRLVNAYQGLQKEVSVFLTHLFLNCYAVCHIG